MRHQKTKNDTIVHTASRLTTWNKSPVFQRLTVTGWYSHVYATPLFPYVELIYAHWYTRTYQTQTAVARLLRFERGAGNCAVASPRESGGRTNEGNSPPNLLQDRS